MIEQWMELGMYFLIAIAMGYIVKHLMEWWDGN